MHYTLQTYHDHVLLSNPPNIHHISTLLVLSSNPKNWFVLSLSFRWLDEYIVSLCVRSTRMSVWNIYIQESSCEGAYTTAARIQFDTFWNVIKFCFCSAKYCRMHQVIIVSPRCEYSVIKSWWRECGERHHSKDLLMKPPAGTLLPW